MEVSKMAQKKENIKGKSTQHKGAVQNKNTKNGTYTKKSTNTNSNVKDLLLPLLWGQELDLFVTYLI